MAELAIIGGSGLTNLAGLNITRQQVEQSPFGEPSGILSFGEYAGKEIIFLPRHGSPHVIPPHMINYRANIWVLKENGIRNIFGINAVGGITQDMSPGRLVVPDQVIDYTWARGHTYFDDGLSRVTHIDFTGPYSNGLRQDLIDAAASIQLDVCPHATYGVTQGPRLETAAEIKRLQQDGCDIVGMTGMPEAALARELEMDYASIAIIANRAAGKSAGIITMAMVEANLNKTAAKVHALLAAVIPKI